jgi:hypothetical protein
MFAIGDKNRDGFIDFADFQSLMQTHFRHADDRGRAAY